MKPADLHAVIGPDFNRLFAGIPTREAPMPYVTIPAYPPPERGAGVVGTHTPGPWHVRTFDGSQWSIDAPGDLCVAQAHQIRPLTFDLTQDERSANARLIAAAPELLAELERALDWIEDSISRSPPAHEQDSAPLVPGRAAIAKATGAES